MSDNTVIQRAGLLLILLLAVFAIATLFGVSWAGEGAIALIMLGAGILGIDELIARNSAIEIFAGVLLLGSGIAGAVWTVLGQNPFAEWTIIGPMAIGIAINFFTNEDGLTGVEKDTGR